MPAIPWFGRFSKQRQRYPVQFYEMVTMLGSSSVANGSNAVDCAVPQPAIRRRLRTPRAAFPELRDADGGRKYPPCPYLALLMEQGALAGSIWYRNPAGLQVVQRAVELRSSLKTRACLICDCLADGVDVSGYMVRSGAAYRLLPRSLPIGEAGGGLDLLEVITCRGPMTQT